MWSVQTWQHHSCYTITSLKTDRRQSCSLLSCCLHQPFEYRTTEKMHHRKNPDYCCSLDIFLFFRLVPEWDACVWKSQYILISEIFRPTCSSVTTCFIQNHLNDLSFSFWCSVWTSAGHIGLNTLSYCHVISSWSFSHKKEREKKKKVQVREPTEEASLTTIRNSRVEVGCKVATIGRLKHLNQCMLCEICR